MGQQFGLVSTKSSRMSVVSCWVKWVLAGWSGMASAGASCLCSTKSLTPHSNSLGLLKWWLFPREQSPGLVLTHRHFCHILFGKSSHRGIPDSKDREIDNTCGSEELLNHTVKDVNKGQKFGTISTRNLPYPNSSTHTQWSMLPPWDYIYFIFYQSLISIEWSVYVRTILRATNNPKRHI